MLSVIPMQLPSPELLSDFFFRNSIQHLWETIMCLSLHLGVKHLTLNASSLTRRIIMHTWERLTFRPRQIHFLWPLLTLHLLNLRSFLFSEDSEIAGWVPEIPRCRYPAFTGLKVPSRKQGRSYGFLFWFWCFFPFKEWLLSGPWKPRPS